MKPLTDYLSELDKKRIKNYILKYGGITDQDKIQEIGEDPAYVDRWLSNWAKNKKKLFRLFGNSFIISKKVKVQNSPQFFYKYYEGLWNELSNLHKHEKEKTYTGVPTSANNFLDFLHRREFLKEIVNMQIYTMKNGKKTPFFAEMEKLKEMPVWQQIGEYNNIEYELSDYFNSSFTFGVIEVNPGAERRLRRDLPDGKYKELRIVKGEKIEKLQRKILDFIDFKENHPYFYEEFLYFEKKIQEVKSQKGHDAILCLSIHPLDFMTMSDNDNHWTSCMNWSEDYEGGCYRIGTVEMMNSDVTVCAYVISENETKQKWNFGIYNKTYWQPRDFYFPDIDPCYDDVEEWTWNNKSWRCLYYITKDILVSGKSYPYYNHNLNMEILDTLKDMVKDKFNWEYSFGVQEYKDMQHSYYCTFQNARDRDCNIINAKGKKKHNILFETRGMYNDFLLNKDFNGYFCYRNYVKKTKIISLSGIPLSIYSTKPFQTLCIHDCANSDEYTDRYGETDLLF